MSWDTTLVTMVRALIGDTDSDNYIYSDSKIANAVVVGGLISAREFPFVNTYIFNLSDLNISPDPTESSSLDYDAVALFSLKAACMLNMNSYQSAINTGGGSVSIQDAGTQVDVDNSSAYKGYADILKNGPCASYTSLLKKLSNSASSNLGRAVLSPYSSGYGYGYRGNRWSDNYYELRSFWNMYF